MIAFEQRFDKVRELVSTLEEFVVEGGRSQARADKVERDVFGQLLELGRELMQVYFDQAGDGDQGQTIQRSDKTLKRQGTKERNYHSIFGCLLYTSPSPRDRG